VSELQHLIDRTDVGPWSFSHFDGFLSEYEGRFEREYGYFRPIVFTIHMLLRVFFKFKRRLPGDLSAPNGRSGSSPGGTPASYGLYANAHRGYVKKTGLETSPLRIVESELKPAHSKGWAAMIRYFSWPFSRAGGSPDEIRRIGHHGRLPGRPSPPLKPSLTGSEVRFMLPCDGKMGQWEQRCSKDVPSASAAEKETLILQRNPILESYKLGGRRKCCMARSVTSTNDETAKVGLFTQILFYTFVFSIAFYLFHVQVFSAEDIAELRAHLKFVRTLAANPFEFIIPHPGFHYIVLIVAKASRLSIEYSGIIVLSLFVVIISVMINTILNTLIRESYSERFILFVGGCLLLVSSIYFPPVSKNFYLGQGSANFWAVPTLIVVKPFALISVILLVKLQTTKEERQTFWYRIALSIALVISAIMKPNFVLGFLPVGIIYLLIKCNSMGNGFFRSFLPFTPVILMLLLQYYFNYRGSSSEINFTFFGVWKLYSKHIFFSILLGTAFPLSILAIRFRFLLRNDFLLLSWLFWGITFLQFSFIAEKKHFGAGNFSWGYNIALWLLFIFSSAEFFSWLKKENRETIYYKSKVIIVSLLFSLHLTSGIAYLAKQLSGGQYY